MLLWGLSWILPWAVWLDFSPWARVIISMILFVVPGMVFSMILGGKNFTLPAHVTNGLAISILLVGIFGLLGRALNFPFSFIKPVFALTGLIGLFFLFKYSRAGYELYEAKNYSVIILISLLIVLILGVLATQSGFGGDNTHYLVYLTSWQHAQSLSFQSVYTGMGDLDRLRFWINMFPMNLAFLAEISQLHGILLLGFYLPPSFTVIAIIATYNLYERLLRSEHHAVIALLAQFVFLLLFQYGFQFGGAFFGRLSEDKAFASFILAPVFFGVAHHFGQSFTVRSGALVFLTGWSLALTHPIALAYSVFVAGIYLGVIALTQRAYTKLGTLALLFAVIVLPPATLRIAQVPWVSSHIFRLDAPVKQPGSFDLETAISRKPDVDETRVSVIAGTPFYGFNTRIIRIPTEKTKWPAFLEWSYLYILVGGFAWSLFNLQKKEIAPFIAASSLLVLVCGIPYTGWLMGYLVTVRMLWRAPWVMPIGLAAYVLFYEIALFVRKRFNLGVEPPNQIRILNSSVILCCIGAVCFFFSFSMTRWNAQASDSLRKRLEGWADLGNYLEDNIKQPSRFVAPTRDLMNRLPGLSSKSKTAYFHANGIQDGERELWKNTPILSDNYSFSLSQRMKILRKNDIKYIFTEGASLKDYYANYPEHFSINEFNGFWIIEFKSLNP
jgi:hypothetical protein